MEGSPPAADEFIVGQVIQARYSGGPKYYRGKVAAVNDDGTYKIDYDDVGKESAVKAELIRVPKDQKPKQPSCELQVVLLKNGATPNVADKDGNTPLHEGKSVELMTALLEHGSDLEVANKVSLAISMLLHTRDSRSRPLNRPRLTKLLSLRFPPPPRR